MASPSLKSPLCMVELMNSSMHGCTNFQPNVSEDKKNVYTA